MDEDMKIRLVRVQNPKGIDLMKEKLLLDGYLDKNEYVNGLKEAIEGNPRNIFVMQAWDEDKAALVAFIIAVNYSNNDHIFVLQAWCESNEELMQIDITDRIFFRLMLWCIEVGKTQIRLETQRSLEAVNRRWGFVEQSKILKFDVPDDLEEWTVSRIKKTD
jgi:hypothetical protein